MLTRITRDTQIQSPAMILPPSLQSVQDRLLYRRHPGSIAQVHPLGPFQSLLPKTLLQTDPLWDSEDLNIDIIHTAIPLARQVALQEAQSTSRPTTTAHLVSLQLTCRAHICQHRSVHTDRGEKTQVVMLVGSEKSKFVTFRHCAVCLILLIPH
jgi:hypothetical protein